MTPYLLRCNQYRRNGRLKTVFFTSPFKMHGKRGSKKLHVFGLKLHGSQLQKYLPHGHALWICARSIYPLVNATNPVRIGAVLLPQLGLSAMVVSSSFYELAHGEDGVSPVCSTSNNSANYTVGKMSFCRHLVHRICIPAGPSYGPWGNWPAPGRRPHPPPFLVVFRLCKARDVTF